jgi:hypothetical protein
MRGVSFTLQYRVMDRGPYLGHRFAAADCRVCDLRQDSRAD